MKLVKRIIFITVTIILGLLFAYNVYNFVCIKILKQDVATIKGYALLEVVSGSMEPEIHLGDMIIINTNAQNYRRGDVITYRDNSGALVTHRIISIDEKQVITKGDSNNTEDNPITKDQIIGKALYKIYHAGIIISSFKSPVTLVMILIIGILVCIFLSLDKDGNPILDDEEKEFFEFLEMKYKSENKKGKNTSNKKK